MFRKKPVSSYRPDPETAAAYAPGAPASQPARKNPGLRFPRILLSGISAAVGSHDNDI